MNTKQVEAPRICVGAFSSAHGVQGLLKLKSFMDRPEMLLQYAPLSDESGKRIFDLTLKGKAGKDMLIVALKDVASREEAEKLKNHKIYARAEILPEADEGEFYIAALMECKVYAPTGELIGEIISLQNYGASDIVAIKESNGQESLFAFTEANFPEIDIENKRVVLNRPEEI